MFMRGWIASAVIINQIPLKYPADVGHEDVNLLLELLIELRNFEEALEVSDVIGMYHRHLIASSGTIFSDNLAYAMRIVR